jgi:phospholipid/cholesterol/gamma-HCH transport system substrate-binding protein
MFMKQAKPMKAGTSPVKLRLYGLVFLAVLALLLSLAVAAYRQAFTPVVRITLQADTIGNQLEPAADVKLRGLIVGQVRDVRADGTKAILGIALNPEHVDDIPANVEARLLPKTLFGEKYVDLVEPRKPATRHIRAGDVITQDRTRAGIEVQQLMNDLLPLLRTVQPAELNATLSAFADALEGRGDRIGGNLARVQRYLHTLNPHLPQIKEDIARFADVTAVYADAAPDLLKVLRNTITSSHTLVEKRDTFAALLTGTTAFAKTGQGLLSDNADRIITLNRISRPTLALLARYAPEFPCLLGGLAKQEPMSEKVFAGGEMHITLEIVQSRPAYHPGEEPRYADRSGPDCRGLPSPQVPAPDLHLNDGTRASSASASEQDVIGALVAPVMGVPADQVPPVATLLFGPLARGTAVSVA